MTDELSTAIYNARCVAGRIENEVIREAALAAIDRASDAIATATAKAHTITLSDGGVTVAAPTGGVEWHPTHKLSTVKALHPFATVVDNRTPVPPRPTKVELHLSSSPLTRSERLSIKEIGGTYTECRGYASTRVVTIPLAGEGRRLADRLVANHATGERTVAIFLHYVDRDGNRVIKDSVTDRVLYVPNGSSFSDYC